jgi:hypothetical protein
VQRVELEGRPYCRSLSEWRTTGMPRRTGELANLEDLANSKDGTTLHKLANSKHNLQMIISTPSPNLIHKARTNRRAKEGV